MADLDSETLDTFEVGLRSNGENVFWEATIYAMRKENFIFRDSNGFNVSDGKTDHHGIETAVDWQINPQWNLRTNITWAKHEYAWNRPSSGIVDGNAADTAPEWLLGARVKYQPMASFWSELEWVHMDEYFIDPGNRHSYEGHDLLHWRAFYRLANTPHQFGLRITNLLDDYYAERADFAFQTYRYFPGAGRRVFLEWRYLR